MKKTTKKILRVIISLIYIIWGITAPITTFSAIVALDVSAIIGGVVGILMLLAGLFGLFGVKSGKCKIFGVIIFIGAAISFAMSFLGGSFVWSSLITAILAWLFIICI